MFVKENPDRKKEKISLISLANVIKNRVLCFTVLDCNDFNSKFNRDSVSVTSNASNQSELSVRPQSTLVVSLLQKKSRGRPAKLDEIKPK